MVSTSSEPQGSTGGTARCAETSGARIAFVHFGEGSPSDEGYRPGRHGRLARFLTARGHDVHRVVPSFRHDERVHRPIGMHRSDEGVAHVVPTTGYDRNRGLRRIRFIVSLARGAASVVRAERPDAVLVGMPPPGMVAVMRLAVGRRARIVADVRDLWPDAFRPSGRGVIARSLPVAGRMLAQELRLADGAVSLSALMLERAPASRRLAVCPIGIDPTTATLEPADADRAQTGPLRVGFIGNLGPGLDFEPMLEALRSTDASLTVHVHGRGPRTDELRTTFASYDRVSFEGPVPRDQVPALLATFDVGIVPRVAGFGTCLSNKIFEYLGAGLHVLFRLEPGVGDELVDHGLGTSCVTAADWRRAFESLAADVAGLRATRSARHELALDHYSSARSNERFASALEDLIDAR